MGGSEKQHMMINFNLLHISHLLHHHHHHHHHDHHRGGACDKDETKTVPKGCMAVLVGQESVEELQRFVIPIVYVNHPLFLQLLKEAEEEYGFDQKGPITIPCRVEEFRNVQGLIDREQHQHHHHVINDHHHHHNHHHFLCFKA